MYKYAEIYGGKVRDLKESELGYVDFCSIWQPTCYWIDVTGVENVEIGYIIKFSQELGTYFEAPIVYEEPTLESMKRGKLEILDKRFEDVVNTAYIKSSLGFYANAGQRAKNDVDGLITQMEGEGLSEKLFMDYDNIPQTVTLEQMKILQLEIIKNGEFIYYQKWDLRNKINNAETEEALNNINIALYMYDFIEQDYII